MITAVWAFALTSQFENGIFQTIKNAFYLGISWLPRTLVMCVLWLVPVALLAFAPFILSRIIVMWPALFFWKQSTSINMLFSLIMGVRFAGYCFLFLSSDAVACITARNVVSV